MQKERKRERGEIAGPERGKMKEGKEGGESDRERGREKEEERGRGVLERERMREGRAGF